MADLSTTISITIDAPPEKVWEAITTGEIIREWFFGVETEADWTVGGMQIPGPDVDRRRASTRMWCRKEGSG